MFLYRRLPKYSILRAEHGCPCTVDDKVRYLFLFFWIPFWYGNLRIHASHDFSQRVILGFQITKTTDSMADLFQQLQYLFSWTCKVSPNLFLHLYPLQGLWWFLKISDGSGGGGSSVSCCSQPRYVCLAPCDAHFVSQFGLYGKPGRALARGP